MSPGLRTENLPAALRSCSFSCYCGGKTVFSSRELGGGESARKVSLWRDMEVQGPREALKVELQCHQVKKHGVVPGRKREDEGGRGRTRGALPELAAAAAAAPCAAAKGRSPRRAPPPRWSRPLRGVVCPAVGAVFWGNVRL